MNYLKFCLFLVLLNACSPKFHITRFSPKLEQAVYGINEPAVAINSKNTQEIAIGTVYNHFFYTKNGGKSWNEELLFSTLGVRGDPALQFDNDGALYYFHLANITTKNSLDRIVCQRSTQLGSTFDNGTFTKVNGKQHDKESVYYDPSTDIFHLTWTQFDKYGSTSAKDSSHILYSSSNDKTKTWSDPIRLNTYGGNCIDDDNTLEGVVSVTDIKNNIYTVWMGPKGIQSNTFDQISKVWRGEKTIQALSYGWEIAIPGLQRANGFGNIVCDKSKGKNHGRIYFSWVDNHADNYQNDVWLIFSDDNATTWSKAQKVGKDKFLEDQFFSTMALDQSDGSLYIAYYDISNYSKNEKNQNFNMMLSSSKDGGNSFKEEKINIQKLCSNPDIFFGDYNSISAVNGTLVLAYSTLENEKCTVEVAIKRNKSNKKK